jgi:hypothetical protein
MLHPRRRMRARVPLFFPRMLCSRGCFFFLGGVVDVGGGGELSGGGRGVREGAG